MMSRLSGIYLEITIDGQRVPRCPECVIELSRRLALTRAQLTLPDPDGSVWRFLRVGQKVEIRYSYRGALSVGEFAGTVGHYEPSVCQRDQVVVRADGPERPLLSVRMKESWMDEPATVLARRILAASGLPVGFIALPDVVIPRMSVCRVNLREAICQLVNSIETGFGQNLSGHSLRLEDGKWVLDEKTLPGNKLVVATGSGLIRHRRSGFGMEVETWLSPFVKPMMAFNLEDQRRGISGEMKADSVIHRIMPKSVRTFLTYGGEYARFQC